MKTLSAKARTILSSVRVERTIEQCFSVLLGQQIDRKLYVEIDAVLQEFGGIWNRKARVHLFKNDPSAKLAELCSAGAYISKKQDFGFFETPKQLAEELVIAADIQPGMRVLEPSAGRGALVRAVLSAQFSAQIWTVEINPETYKEFVDEFSDSPVRFGSIVSTCADFLVWDGPLDFDRVVMNPPFKLLSDIAHVLRGYNSLKPDGKLAAIMSAAWTFRDTAKAKQFRRLVEANGTWKRLPKGSFNMAGTNVETTMITLRKS